MSKDQRISEYHDDAPEVILPLPTDSDYVCAGCKGPRRVVRRLIRGGSEYGKCDKCGALGIERVAPRPTEWETLNRERGRLIDQQIAGTLNGAGCHRLAALTAYADARLEVIAPRPSPSAEAQLDKLRNEGECPNCAIPANSDAALDAESIQNAVNAEYVQIRAERAEAIRTRNLAQEASTRDLEAKRAAESRAVYAETHAKDAQFYADRLRRAELAARRTVDQLRSDLAEAMPFVKWLSCGSGWREQERTLQVAAVALLAKHAKEVKDVE